MRDFDTQALDEVGVKIANTIMQAAANYYKETINGGGCKAFYSKEEWTARGERYGKTSNLIVVHDGGDLAPMFNYDYECYNGIEAMNNALKNIGYYAEPCTGWYTAIYPI